MLSKKKKEKGFSNDEKSFEQHQRFSMFFQSVNVLQDSDRSLPHSDLNYFLCCVFVRTGGFFFLFFARIMFLKFLIFFPICEKPKWKNTFSVELFFPLQKIQEFINMFFFYMCERVLKKQFGRKRLSFCEAHFSTFLFATH